MMLQKACFPKAFQSTGEQGALFGKWQAHFLQGLSFPWEDGLAQATAASHAWAPGVMTASSA